MMQDNEDKPRRHEGLKHLYAQIVNLIIHCERSISDRTSIFLVFNSFMFAAFIQLLNHDELAFFVLKVLVIVFGLIICILQLKLVLSLLETLTYYRKKAVLMENDDDFYYPYKKDDNEMSFTIFDEKTKADISRYYVGIARSRNPLNKLFASIISSMGIESYFVYSGEIFGIYMPVLVFILWLVSLVFITVTYVL